MRKLIVMSATDVSTQTQPAAAARGGGELETIDLDITGMTCGSCAARVQRALSRQPGVTEALVNYATGRASVELQPASLDMQALVSAVEQAGYGASPAASSAGARGP
jgi:Cu+-exporting ATPase